MIIILGIVILYFIFFFRYQSKKRKKKLASIPQEEIKTIPIQRKQSGNLSKSINLNYDFSISEMNRKKDYLQVTLLIHNLSKEPVEVLVKNAFYISSKTKTQYEGDCTYFSYAKLGEKSIDSIILPGFNVKRECNFYRFDLNEFYDEDCIIIQANFNNQLYTIKKQIFETDLQSIKAFK
ncbi:hypothetical protein [Empedobacter brevis]|uniref:hypothetical protein n=1 Tax=Empedobacter brevis TaxID=247 RepID=UPI00333FDDC4